jgi:hypothetical protein
MTRLLLGFALAGVLATGSAFAHHAAVTLGTVTLTQPVMAGGTTLQPGTYQLRDTGEHPQPLPGQSADAQAYVEFVSNGTVAAREIAEVMAGAPAAVGTSGATSGGAGARARVERLRGDEFLRVSVTHNGERYLIHLPMSAK